MSSNLVGNHDLAYQGFEDLIGNLQNYISKTEKPLDVLEIGAKEFVNDLMKLTKPYSKIKKSGYTHLIDTFSYRKNKKDVEVGWGKNYGRMVEDGTKKMKSQSHLYPTFQKNKEKYYKKMVNFLNK